MKKYLAILITFLMLVLVAGCSSTTDTKTEEEDKTADTTTEATVVGEWEAAEVAYKDDQMADIVLTLDEDGNFSEDVFYLTTEDNVKSETPDIQLSGTYKTEEDKIILTNEKVVKDGETYEGEDVAKALDQEGVDTEYSYELVDDTLTINASEGHEWVFVKM